MTKQIDIFAGAGGATAAREDFPDGFVYQPDLLAPDEEAALLGHVRALPFRAFEFHGYRGKRRVVSFGWHYDSGTRKLRKADAMPPFLVALRARVAPVADVDPDDLRHVLVTEYGPGAAIGWHRDKSVFGTVVGVSLLAACVFRLRRRVDERWERVSLIAEPRSVYVLGGAVRDEWEHSIPPVNLLRYSVTFRTLRDG